MKIGLTENIEKKINIDRIKFVSNLETHLSKKFQLFPDKILSGKLIDNKLNLKVSPSWTIRIFLTIWYILSLLMIFKFDYSDFVNSLKFIGIELIWIITPLVLTRLKVRWDRIRLERKIK